MLCGWSKFGRAQLRLSRVACRHEDYFLPECFATWPEDCEIIRSFVSCRVVDVKRCRSLSPRSSCAFFRGPNLLVAEGESSQEHGATVALRDYFESMPRAPITDDAGRNSWWNTLLMVLVNMGWRFGG